MRHRKRKGRLGRTSSHGKAELKNLALSLFIHQKIKTTMTKAKATHRFADRLISLAKDGTIGSQNMAMRLLGNKRLVQNLFKEIGPLFKSRQGGYTRIFPLYNRTGDGARMAILELTEKREIKKPTPKKEAKEEKPKRREKPAEPKKEERKAPRKPEKERPKEEKGKPKKSFFKGLKKYFRGRAE